MYSRASPCSRFSKSSPSSHLLRSSSSSPRWSSFTSSASLGKRPSIKASAETAVTICSSPLTKGGPRGVRTTTVAPNAAAPSSATKKGSPSVKRLPMQLLIQNLARLEIRFVVHLLTIANVIPKIKIRHALHAATLDHAQNIENPQRANRSFRLIIKVHRTH